MRYLNDIAPLLRQGICLRIVGKKRSAGGPQKRNYSLDFNLISANHAENNKLILRKTL